MTDFSTGPTDPPPGRDAWQDDNDRGLRLAADGDWSEALDAFASAADGLGRSPSPGAQDPLALALGNLAQACFRVGRLDDAIQYQQRAAALRVTLTDEESMPVARARMDLAVMLASAGQHHEAWALMQHVITSVEHHVGAEDTRLAIVLENAARIALASGNTADARPLLVRLHALLTQHQRPTAPADSLLAEIASGHAPLAQTLRVQTLRTEEQAPVTALEEWEDQPLRDAVSVTDGLLRATPSGVPIVPPTTVIEPPLLDAEVLAPAADGHDAALDRSVAEAPRDDSTPVRAAAPVRRARPPARLRQPPTQTGDGSTLLYFLTGVVVLGGSVAAYVLLR